MARLRTAGTGPWSACSRCARASGHDCVLHSLCALCYPRLECPKASIVRTTSTMGRRVLGGLTDRHPDSIQKGCPRRVIGGFFIVMRDAILELDFAKLDGLITTVIQDHLSGRVLMVGFMNEESFRLTVESGKAVFFSRSRQKLWRKGESSGHSLLVKEIQTDCDTDALLIKVEAVGPGVCHAGYVSCFYRTLKDKGEWLETEPRTYDPSQVYGN